MRTALITGASGFCARHLIGQLKKKEDIQIIGCDIQSPHRNNLALDKYMNVDILNIDQTNNIIWDTKPDIVFHLAGVSQGRTSHIYQVNILGTINLLEAIKMYSPKSRVLIVGSAAEYGYVPAAEMPICEDHACNPTGAYGLSKYLQTLAALYYAKHQGIHAVVVRPFNIIGAGAPPTLVVGAVLARLKRAIKNSSNPFIKVGNLEAQRDFIAVEDVVSAYITITSGNYWGEVFNICSGTLRSIRSVVEKLISFSECKIRIETDLSIKRLDDVQSVYGSYKKAQVAFGFMPKVEIDKALKSAWDFAMGVVN